MPISLPAILQNATMYETGEDTAVLTFNDPELLFLCNVVVNYIKDTKYLVYDQECTDQRGRAFTRNRGEGFFVPERSSVKSYKIGKTDMIGIPMSDCMLALLNNVNTFVKNPFQAMFVNHYRNNNDGIPFHSDKGVDEDELTGVLVISWGVSRKLKFHPVDRSNTSLRKQDIHTGHGEALLMYGKSFQNKMKHCISKCKTSAGDRFSFTFRCHNNVDSKKRKRS
jgi:hypothetical protein